MTLSEKLQKIAENELKVFTAGKDAGYSEGFNVGYDEGHTVGFDEGQAQGSAEGWQQGLDEGVVIGKKSQYDEFWDAFQQNGNRVNYDYGFYGRQWTKDILKPKYRIAPTSANQMFINNNYNGDLRELGVELDFSICTNVSNLFAYANQIKHIGTVDMSSATSIAGAFVGCTSLVSIDEVVFASNGSQAPGTSIFKNCSALENIVVSGKIGQSISFGDSKKLSKDSITSIINALKADASGQTLTLSVTAKNNAFLTSEWDALIATKSNWKISLV